MTALKAVVSLSRNQHRRGSLCQKCITVHWNKIPFSCSKNGGYDKLDQNTWLNTRHTSILLPDCLLLVTLGDHINI